MSSKSQVVLNPGKVSAIKTQFEKLCNAAEVPQKNTNLNTCKCNNSNNNNRRSFGLPSTNRSISNHKIIINNKNTINNNNNNNNNNNHNNMQTRHKPPVPIKTFHLQRSITSLELQRPSREQIDNFRMQQQNLFRKSFQRQVSIPPLTTEVAIEKSSNYQIEDEIKPLPPLSSSGTKTTMLSRCTVDPVKRNSIKRSPAFRVGDKQNNAVLLKQLPTPHPATSTSLADQQNRKSGITKTAYRSILHSSGDSTTGITTRQLNSFLAHRCAAHLEQMQQPGMTDSIRAALLRPLPSGPPPKKPPRTSEIVTADKTNKRKCA